LAGCLTDVEENESSMICPCCQRIFHVDCVQSMALSYGRAHIKCPTCGEKSKFSDEALYQGVYIPEKDAAWENPAEESFYNAIILRDQFELFYFIFGGGGSLKHNFCYRGKKR